MSAARLILLTGLWCFSCAAINGDESGPAFPGKPIQIIVPFKAGGGSDNFARLIQRTVADHQLLPHPLVIINVPGAGGTIGSRKVLHAEPDGYTILFLHDAILTARYSGQATWGPEDFEPIAATGRSDAIVAVREDSRFKTLPGLLKAAEEKPDEITYATNIGAPSHFWALLLEQSTPGARFRFVQTGGGTERFGALKGGHLEVTVFSVAEHLVFREDGLRGLAMLTEERHPALPDVPTAREGSIDVVAGNLQSWWAPKSTSTGRIAIIAEALRSAMKKPGMIEAIDRLQIDPVFLGPGELRTGIEQRRDSIAKVAPRAVGGLPDLPLFLGIAAAISGLAAFGISIRPNRVRSPIRQGSIPDRRGLFRGIGVFLLTVAFAVLLQFRLLAFPAACMLLVISIALLSGQRRKTLMRTVSIVVFAAVLGFGIDYVFRSVFLIDLP